MKHEYTQRLNRPFYEKCTNYGFHFITSGAVSERDLWAHVIDLTESGKTNAANNFIEKLNIFIRTINHACGNFR